MLFLSLIAIAAVPAAGQPAPPPDPAFAVIAGERLVLIDQFGHPWVRGLPLAPESPWTRVELPKGWTAATQLFCAPDGSGLCAMLLGRGPTWTIGTLSAEENSVRDLEIPTREIVSFHDPGSLHFIPAGGSGEARLLAYDLTARVARPAGILRPGEMLDFVIVDARPELIARSRVDGSARTVDREPALRFPMIIPRIEILSPRGMLYLEPAQPSAPVLAGRRSLLILDLRADGRGQVTAREGVIASQAIDEPLLDENTLVIDAAGDIFATTTAADGRALVAACRDTRNRMAFVPVRQIAPNENVRLIATPAGAGLVALIGTEAATAQVHVLQLGPRPSGDSVRTCADIAPQIRDAGLPVEGLPAPWQAELLDRTLPDGTPLPLVVYHRRDQSPEHLIIDVYGAYGRIRRFAPPDAAERNLLGRERTALAVITVRGDGNAGFAAAMASRAPHRQLAVDDLIAVAEQLRARFPGVGRVTARGASAGAWLAVAAALQRPDLFAGAIAGSGGYIFSEDRLVAGGWRFFSPDDSLERGTWLRPSSCPGLQFRFLHARDDVLTGFDQAERFVAMLNDRGCAARLIAFDVGGHTLARTLSPADSRRELEGYNTPLAAGKD